MKRLISWVRCWFAFSSVARQVSGSQLMLDRLDGQRQESAARLKQRESELLALAERIKTDLDNAALVHRRYEAALDEVREKNRVLELTIQTLVSSHRLLLERYDAETAIAVRTRVAASVRE